MIDKHPAVLKIYQEQLTTAGTVTCDEVEQRAKQIQAVFENDYLEAKSYTPDPAEWLASNWQVFSYLHSLFTFSYLCCLWLQGKAIGSLVSERPYNQTGVDIKTLKRIGMSLTHVPADMVIHDDIKHLLRLRRKMVDSEKGITMAFAEALAFGCLMARFSPEENEGREGRALLAEMQVKRCGIVSIPCAS